MKTLFLNPFLDRGEKAKANSPLLGVLYLAAVMEKNGYSVKVVDSVALGFDWNDLREKLIQENPDIVGITATTLSMPALIKTANFVKQYLPKVKIIVGGFGPTIEPEKTIMENPAIDIAVLGDGEKTIAELMEYFSGKRSLKDVKGIAYKENNQFIKSADQEIIMDLDSIPWPAYHLLEPDFHSYHGVHSSYSGISKPNVVMLASRGCPHRCIFCCLGSKKVRFRDPKKIVDEIEFYYKTFKIKSVQLYDDEFVGMTSLQNKWILEICEEIKKRGLDKLGFLVQGRCSKFIDFEVLKKMREAGFKWVWWGVESGSQKVLDLIQKDLSISDVKRTFKLAKQAGIRSLMFIMVGFPGETREDVMLSAKIIKEIKPDRIRIHVVTPLPGSKLWQMLAAKNQIEIANYCKYDTRLNVVHRTDELSSSEIKELYEMLLFRFENGYWYFIKIILRSLFTEDGWKKLPQRMKKASNHFFQWLKLSVKFNK